MRPLVDFAEGCPAGLTAGMHTYLCAVSLCGSWDDVHRNTGRGLIRAGDRLATREVFEFTRVNQARDHIPAMTRVPGVSPGGLDVWRDPEPSRRRQHSGSTKFGKEMWGTGNAGVSPAVRGDGAPSGPVCNAVPRPALFAPAVSSGAAEIGRAHV